MNNLIELCRNYNLPATHHENKTLILEPEFKQRPRMCLNWTVPLGEFTQFDETKQTRLDFDRNVKIAEIFAKVMAEKGGRYLTSDIDEENGNHVGVGVDSSYTKPLYCISRDNTILGWIETTCIDCPWQGGIGPDFMSLSEAFMNNGMEVLPPGKVEDPELERAIPRSHYKWNLITVN